MALNADSIKKAAPMILLAGGGIVGVYLFWKHQQAGQVSETDILPEMAFSGYGGQAGGAGWSGNNIVWPWPSHSPQPPAISPEHPPIPGEPGFIGGPDPVWHPPIPGIRPKPGNRDALDLPEGGGPVSMPELPALGSGSLQVQSPNDYAFERVLVQNTMQVVP